MGDVYSCFLQKTLRDNRFYLKDYQISPFREYKYVRSIPFFSRETANYNTHIAWKVLFFKKKLCNQKFNKDFSWSQLQASLIPEGWKAMSVFFLLKSLACNVYMKKNQTFSSFQVDLKVSQTAPKSREVRGPSLSNAVLDSMVDWSNFSPWNSGLGKQVARTNCWVTRGLWCDPIVWWLIPWWIRTWREPTSRLWET